MGEPGSRRDSGLINVSQMTLSQLRTLDDAVLEESVGKLLRMCVCVGDRHWDSGQRTLH
jgi:hypothetical protein